VRGDHQQAEATFRENLALCQDVGDKLIALESLEGLACAFGARGEAERVARLFGAADTLREVVDSHQSSAERALREPYLVAARSQLDEAVWEAAWSEGQAMTLKEAVRYAHSEDNRPHLRP
jgi:hypothetical protein